MPTPETAYHAAASAIAESENTQMFGKPCYKLNGTSFVSFFQDEMAFKLGGTDHANALALSGAQLFDPSQKGRPFKAWVQVPYAHAEQWPALARIAAKFATE